MSLGTGLAAFGRGFSQGNNIVNAANTADLIRYRREEARRRNERQTILNRTSELANAQMELQIQKLQEEMTKQQNDFVATKFANFLLNGNFKQASELVNSNESLKQAMNAFDIDSFASVDDYAPEFLKKLGMTEELAKNRGDLIVTNDGYNNYKLISREKFAGVLGLKDKYLGVQNQLNTLHREGTNIENQRFLDDTKQNMIADIYTDNNLSDNAKLSEIVRVLNLSDILIASANKSSKTAANVTPGKLTAESVTNITTRLEEAKNSFQQNAVATEFVNYLRSLNINTLQDFYKFMKTNPEVAKNPELKQQLYNMKDAISAVKFINNDIDKTMGSLANFDDVLNDLVAGLSTESVAKITNSVQKAILPQLSSAIQKGLQTSAFKNDSDIRTQLQVTFNKILKADSGAAVTPQEWERFANVFGGDGANYLTVLKGIKAYLQWQLSKISSLQSTIGDNSLFEFRFGDRIRQINTNLAHISATISDVQSKVDKSNMPKTTTYTQSQSLTGQGNPPKIGDEEKFKDMDAVLLQGQAK